MAKVTVDRGVEASASVVLVRVRGRVESGRLECTNRLSCRCRRGEERQTQGRPSCAHNHTFGVIASASRGELRGVFTRV